MLINNAGINNDAQYGSKNARKTLDVNYRGTLEVGVPLLDLRGSLGRARFKTDHNNLSRDCLSKS